MRRRILAASMGVCTVMAVLAAGAAGAHGAAGAGGALDRVLLNPTEARPGDSVAVGSPESCRATGPDPAVVVGFVPTSGEEEDGFSDWVFSETLPDRPVVAELDPVWPDEGDFWPRADWSVDYTIPESLAPGNYFVAAKCRSAVPDWSHLDESEHTWEGWEFREDGGIDYWTWDNEDGEVTERSVIPASEVKWELVEDRESTWGGRLWQLSHPDYSGIYVGETLEPYLGAQLTVVDAEGGGGPDEGGTGGQDGAGAGAESDTDADSSAEGTAGTDASASAQAEAGSQADAGARAGADATGRADASGSAAAGASSSADAGSAAHGNATSGVEGSDDADVAAIHSGAQSSANQSAAAEGTSSAAGNQAAHHGSVLAETGSSSGSAVAWLGALLLLTGASSLLITRRTQRK